MLIHPDAAAGADGSALPCHHAIHTTYFMLLQAERG